VAEVIEWKWRVDMGNFVFSVPGSRGLDASQAL
jgi:hypothetical protein